MRSFGLEPISWATHRPGGTAAPLLALLWERGECVFYVPGTAVDRARDAYRGESETDARDARLIAEQARMRGGNRLLKKVLYQSALSSLRATPVSRAFYDRKRRGEGKRHQQALIALARRRVNVLWAMLRDGTRFQPRFAA